MAQRHIIVIGAGPGGLSAAMILAHRGHRVTVLERAADVGGRNAPIHVDGYTFDVGPTFVMMPQLFEDVFRLAGRDYYRELKSLKIDPMYRLRFSDGRDFTVYNDKQKLEAEFNRVFPGEWAGYQRWFAYHQKKFNRVIDCLRIPYMKPWSYLNPKLLRALPYLQAHRSVMSVLSDYFTSEDLKMSMAFQAKYLGMSPWDCPGTFTILPYMEHAFGISHFRGGVHQLSQAMVRIVREEGGDIRLHTEVTKLVTSGKRITGVQLLNGETLTADEVVMNADFADGMTRLLDEGARPSWTNKKIERSAYSCSTFMIYLGVNKRYDIPHHNIFFGENYRQNLREISETKVLPPKPAMYVQNASMIDPSLAPAGKSTIYVLVPVPNLESSIDWTTAKQSYRDLVIAQLMERSEMKDLDQHIDVERVITPLDWKQDVRVYRGAVFNLAHTINQMLYRRPHNRFDDLENLSIVGGGTHPGSGLPTILESGRIAADLIGPA
jgi:phytoene desaturase